MFDIIVRRLVRRFGFDVERRRTILADVLDRRRVDLVLDVGANEGQFARRLRAWGYRGRIVSFEPFGGAFEVLSRRAAADPDWSVHRLALGDDDGTATLQVAAQTVFSSLLSPTEALTGAFAGAATRATEEVPLRRLDGLFGQVADGARRIFLKVDVQGAELAVLRGARETLPAVTGVQVEVTLRRLYAGEATLTELVAALEDAGLMLSLLDGVAWDPATGAALALDAVFLRPEADA